MIWLATFLLAAGVGDLVRPSHRAVDAAAALCSGVVGALAAGAHDALTVAGAAGFASLGALWTYRRCDDHPTRTLAIFAGGVIAALVLAAVPHPTGGVLERWWGAVHPGRPARTHDVSVWVLLRMGLLLTQLSTGNRIVRQVLLVAVREVPAGNSPLQGGRLLGPMERLIILGLGMAGQPTAASVVIAAKGLLRFPELQSSKRRPAKKEAWGIHQVTEYFLVGSFMSWSVALAALALAALG